MHCRIEAKYAGAAGLHEVHEPLQALVVTPLLHNTAHEQLQWSDTLDLACALLSSGLSEPKQCPQLLLSVGVTLVGLVAEHQEWHRLQGWCRKKLLRWGGLLAWLLLETRKDDSLSTWIEVTLRTSSSFLLSGMRSLSAQSTM